MKLDAIKDLLQSVVRISDCESSLSNRRMAVLENLIKLTGAICGNWSWGYGFKEASSPMPIAIICVGMSEEQINGFTNMALAPAMDHEFRDPILQRMTGENQMSTLRQDLHDDSEWPNTFNRKQLSKIGLDEWVHCVRYSNDETWSILILYRQQGQSHFQLEDRLLVETAMHGIPWLFASESETLPRTAIPGLTARQRATLLMLLDGKSRKQIAKGFGISEDTVGDHIKHIYRHFNVGSLGELAAIFLRSR